ncbi:cytochrome P460 family protein [Pedobacter antarcticus]|uniref:cytochrome P460 family protein n=1 Tax=Pedobacter antarcticus TaxID=34086 RepID=UPI001C57366E|nr:cytochrome P460 family protein [Pedobacter antarcticus]
MKRIQYCLLIFGLLFGCQQNHPENRNREASLPASFEFSKLGLKTISSIINPELGTTSTLYGNDNALEELKGLTSNHMVEKTLVLVTWKQQDDPRWFGAKIPSDLKLVEVLKTKSSFKDYENVDYRIYEGRTLGNRKDNLKNEDRIKFITSIQPAVMP